MANAYSGGNFNIDTGTNVAGLTTLKGSAPALTDNIYVYNGATLTVEGALSILKIYLGQTSSGAAGAGNRYGILTVNAGVTVTFAGNATATNSGIQMNPTTADASSAGCRVNLNGTSASRITVTNAGNAYDATNQKWSMVNNYGTIQGGFVDFKYPAGNMIVPVNNNADRTSATSMILDNCTTIGLSAGAGVMNLTANGTPSSCIPIRMRFWDNQIGHSASSGNWGLTFFTISVQVLYETAGAEFDMSGTDASRASGSTAVGGYTPILIGTVAVPVSAKQYMAKCIVGPSATLVPAQVIPTGLTFTNLQDGTVKVEVSNISSVSATDLLMVFDASNNRRYSISRVRYEAALDRKPANCGIIAGVPLSAMTGWYAQYTSDNSNFSASSAVASDVTPTFLPAIGNVRPVQYGQGGTEFTGDLSNLTASDAAYLALEATRNISTNISAHKIVAGSDVTVKGTNIAGDVPMAKIMEDATGAGGTLLRSEVLAPKGDYVPSTQPPDAPVISAISFGRGRIKIYIGMTPLTETYDVYRDNVLIPEGEDTTDNFFLDDGLADGTFTYKVVAKNSEGSTTSNIVTADSYLTDQEQNIWDTFQVLMAAHLDTSDFTTVVYNHLDGLSLDDDTGYPSLLIYPVRVTHGTTVSFRIAVHMKFWDNDQFQTETTIEQLENITAALAEIASQETGISVVRYSDPKLATFSPNIIEAYQELTVNLV